MFRSPVALPLEGVVTRDGDAWSVQLYKRSEDGELVGRRYRESDVERLQLVKAAVDAGERIGSIADCGFGFGATGAVTLLMSPPVKML